MTPSASCECRGEEQAADNVVLHCPIHRPLHIAHCVTVLDDETVEWLLNRLPDPRYRLRPSSELKELLNR